MMQIIQRTQGRPLSCPHALESGPTATMVWNYIGELVFNMLVLVGTVKMSDRVVREMMGL